MPPPAAGEIYYSASNIEAYSKGEQQGDSTRQAKEEQNTVFQNNIFQAPQGMMIQTQEAGNTDVTTGKAEAPAFKAPRAP